jgi:chromosome segregation ATPase
VKSEEIQRLERELADEHGNVQKLKEELVKLRLSPEKPPQPTSDDLASREAERTQWSQDRSKWETDRANWEVQRGEWSEERAAAASEAAARAEGDEAKWQQLHSQFSNLEVERDRWIKERERMIEDSVQVAEELAVLTRQRDEYNQDTTTWGADREKWEADRAAWAEEKVGWESERTALKEEREALSRSVAELMASVEVWTAAKVTADKDRDFFREQYTKASAFVGSISEENQELENKAKIAEGQAQEGVAMIKALFEVCYSAHRQDILTRSPQRTASRPFKMTYSAGRTWQSSCRRKTNGQTTIFACGLRKHLSSKSDVDALRMKIAPWR